MIKINNFSYVVVLYWSVLCRNPGKMVPGKLRNEKSWGGRRAPWCVWNVGVWSIYENPKLDNKLKTRKKTRNTEIKKPGTIFSGDHFSPYRYVVTFIIITFVHQKVRKDGPDWVQYLNFEFVSSILKCHF